MAKKPMTKSQIVSHFASKFVLPKKAASTIGCPFLAFENFLYSDGNRR